MTRRAADGGAGSPRRPLVLLVTVVTVVLVHGAGAEAAGRAGAADAGVLEDTTVLGSDRSEMTERAGQRRTTAASSQGQFTREDISLGAVLPPPPTEVAVPSTVEPPVVTETAYRTGSEPVAVLPPQSDTHVLALVSARPTTANIPETTDTQHQTEGDGSPSDHHTGQGGSNAPLQPDEFQHPFGAENEIPDYAPGPEYHEDHSVHHDFEYAHYHDLEHRPVDYVYAEPELQLRRPPRGRRPAGWRGCRRCTRRRPHPQRRRRPPHHRRPQRRQGVGTGILPDLFSWPLPALFQSSFRRRAQRRRSARSAVHPGRAEGDRPRPTRGRAARLFDGPLSVPLTQHGRPFLHTLRPQVAAPPPPPQRSRFVALSTPETPSLRDGVPVPVSQRHTAGPTLAPGRESTTASAPTAAATSTVTPPPLVTETTSAQTPAGGATPPGPPAATAPTAAPARNSAPVTPVPRPATAPAPPELRRHLTGAPSAAVSPPPPPPPPTARHPFRQYLASGRLAAGDRAKTYYLSSVTTRGSSEDGEMDIPDGVSPPPGRREELNSQHRPPGDSKVEEVRHTESPVDNTIADADSLSVMKFLAGFPTPKPTPRPEDATVATLGPNSWPTVRPTQTTDRPTRPAQTTDRPTRPAQTAGRPTRPAQTAGRPTRPTQRPAGRPAGLAQTTSARPARKRTTQVESRFAPQRRPTPTVSVSAGGSRQRRPGNSQVLVARPTAAAGPGPAPRPTGSPRRPEFRPARWYRGRTDLSAIGERVITQVAAPQLLTARRRSW
ncbi:hypothetical protein FJT64_000254 [Amphibalanus amphitrite]|uniref:Uncharacterized protein n=1 Tax=Amphibalanus amphitrite TaxID=1232801 RepID=A0A6A4WG93_AMPAM|nr:hypothetical protein FJT64_000254 [Amphibalanus amphitrite]